MYVAQIETYSYLDFVNPVPLRNEGQTEKKFEHNGMSDLDWSSQERRR